jgi:MFS family permease
VLKKNQITLFILSFLGDFGNSLLLVTSVSYGVTLTEDPLLIGIIGAAYGLTYLITPAILGRLGDRFPRKVSLLIASSGQVFIAIFLFLFFVFTDSPISLIIGQVLLGIVYGFFWPSIEAFTSEISNEYSSITPEQAHKKAILSFCIAWSIGYMFGPLLAGIFRDYFQIGAYITVIVGYCVEFILILLILPRNVHQFEKNRRDKKSEKPNPPTTPQYKIFLTEIIITVLIYAGISKAMYTYFTDYALDINGLYWSSTVTGWVLFCFGLGRTLYFLINYFYPRIKSSMRLNLFTFLGMGLCIIGIPLFNNPITLSIIMILEGVGAGIIYASTLDLMLLEEKESKGAKAGLFESMVGFGSILTPFAAGAIAKVSNMKLPFYVLAGITFFMFLLFLLFEFGTNANKKIMVE